MADAGILGCDEQLELIAGQIVVREPIGARHAGTVDRLNRLWTSRLGERAIVRIQSPVCRLSECFNSAVGEKSAIVEWEATMNETKTKAVANAVFIIMVATAGAEVAHHQGIGHKLRGVQIHAAPVLATHDETTRVGGQPGRPCDGPWRSSAPTR
jgi:hypothetical protein